MKHNKRHYMKLNYDGYEWFGFDDGFHMFHKQYNKPGKSPKWGLMEVTEEMLTNGDVEYMAKHKLTADRKHFK